jgi:hypothetical protein
MANKKISQLDPIGTIDVNQDSIPIVDYSENVTKRTNLANIGQRVLEASTTTNLAEGTNLYFTNTRVYTKVKATLLAGSNTSITFDDVLQTITIASQGNVQSVNTKTGAVVLTTTDISEGTNEYFTAARVRAVVLTGLSLATNAVISATDTVLSAFGKLQAQITANLSTLTSHTSNTSNPHSVTKAQVGLGNADNTSDANKPVSTATQTALNAKQDTLVSNTNIKTVNSTTLLGSGDIAVQPTLVSGANIKTLNSVSLLGSGDIVLAATPSGVSGAIQFSDGSAFASDATNFFWDNTNKRLGVGQSIPTARIHIQGSSAATTSSSLVIFNSTPTEIFRIRDNGNVQIGATTDAGYKLDVNGSFRVNSTTIPAGNSFLVLSAANRTLSFNLSGTGGTYSSLSTALNSSTGSGSFGVTLDGFGTAFIVGSTNNSTSNARFSVNLNSGNAAQTEVIIGSQTSVASSLLTLNSTLRGFLPPRMTTTQKNAISSPATGLMVYDTTLNLISVYNGTMWISL